MKTDVSSTFALQKSSATVRSMKMLSIRSVFTGRSLRARRLLVSRWEPFGDGNLYLNPGSVSLPKEDSPRGYLLLTDSAFLWKDLAGNEYHRLEL